LKAEEGLRFPKVEINKTSRKISEPFNLGIFLPLYMRRSEYGGIEGS